MTDKQTIIIDKNGNISIPIAHNIFVDGKILIQEGETINISVPDVKKILSMLDGEYVLEDGK